MTIQELLMKKDKARFEYAVLIGYYSHKIISDPNKENMEIYNKLCANYEIKFGKKI